MRPLPADPSGAPGRQGLAPAPDDPTQPLMRVPARRILGMRVDATSYAQAAQEILAWAHKGESRYVCVATVNNVIEAYDDPEYGAIIEAADLVTPDGMPLVVEAATRVYGPDLTLVVCRLAAEQGIPVGFFGGTEDVLEKLTARLGQRFPGEKSLAWTNWPLYTVGLVQHGYRDEDIRQILGLNMLRVARQVLAAREDAAMK